VTRDACLAHKVISVVGDSCSGADHGRAGSLQTTSETIQVSVVPRLDSQTLRDVSIMIKNLIQSDIHSQVRPSRRSSGNGSIQFKSCRSFMQYCAGSKSSMCHHCFHRKAPEHTLITFRSCYPLILSDILSENLRCLSLQISSNSTHATNDGRAQGSMARLEE
jgi:hypothetical protein